MARSGFTGWQSCRAPYKGIREDPPARITRAVPLEIRTPKIEGRGWRATLKGVGLSGWQKARPEYGLRNAESGFVAKPLSGKCAKLR